MNTENKIAKAVGALFVITMLLGMIDAYTVAPILNSPFSSYHLHGSQLYIGAFSILLQAISKKGFWFKVKADRGFKPQAYGGHIRMVCRGFGTAIQRRDWAKKLF